MRRAARAEPPPHAGANGRTMERSKSTQSDTQGLRIAYLCNVYPAVSHSFVRREIEALIALGHEVVRFSIRPPHTDLEDAADIREARSTEVVLGRGFVKFLMIAIGQLLSHPLRAATALAAACRMSGAAPKQVLRHGAYLLEAAWLRRRCKQLGVRHLHAHFGTNPAAVGLLTRALGGPPFSFTVHGPDEFDAPVALALHRKIAAAAFVVAISSFGRSQLMRWSAKDQWGKIQLIRCGVGDSFLDAATTPSQRSTEFCCVARLTAQKGLPLLIEACERLNADGEEFSVTIIGDGELRQALETEVRAKGLQGRVTLAGSKSAVEIQECLLRARAFVLPSFAEGLPVVLMEALAVSRPVITTSIAGIPELVDASCGWLIPAGSTDALVSAMREALHASAAELAAKGRSGSQRVRRMHSARRGAELIAEAMRTQPPAPAGNSVPAHLDSC